MGGMSTPIQQTSRDAVAIIKENSINIRGPQTCSVHQPANIWNTGRRLLDFERVQNSFLQGVCTRPGGLHDIYKNDTFSIEQPGRTLHNMCNNETHETRPSPRKLGDRPSRWGRVESPKPEIKMPR